mmetsp:Transcript_4477/g.8745  ORF Transcript_4477/g.8745 Transcript_4477/m.8745 type:complete len:107 (-) Transcript_4477:1542-1862(-)
MQQYTTYTVCMRPPGGRAQRVHQLFVSLKQHSVGSQCRVALGLSSLTYHALANEQSDDNDNYSAFSSSFGTRGSFSSEMPFGTFGASGSSEGTSNSEDTGGGTGGL